MNRSKSVMNALLPLGDDRFQTLACGVVGLQCVVDGLWGGFRYCADAMRQVQRTHPVPVDGGAIGVLGHDAAHWGMSCSDCP